jgi:3-oxoacyl-[acyl-carrier-protein] synthase III
VLAVAVNTEFTNFTKSLLLAWEAVLAGHCRYALVVVGSGLTRNMDYRAPHAFQTGDGAGAVVLGASERLRLVDHRCALWSDDYGAMTMQYRGARGSRGEPIATYHIEPDAGRAAFLQRGMHGPPALVKELLAAHGLSGDDISLLVHQASERLLRFWDEQIRPAALLTTFPFYGHMPVANHAVNLAHFAAHLRTPYLVMCAIGVPTHLDAVLIRV